MPSFGLSNARAEASRRNGAKSRGPKTPVGKARSAHNALKHGLRAQKYVVLPDEDGAAFQVLEAALMEELAPRGALQTVLARRVVVAAWRLERAERLEAELFAENHFEAGNLGLALIRDCRRGRAFETLVRYRGGTLAEFWRALRTLKALQAEEAAPQAAARPGMQAPAVSTRQLTIEPNAGRSGCIESAQGPPRRNPIEPESHGNPGKSEAEPEPARNPGVAHAPASEPQPSPLHACSALPNEPRANRDDLAVEPRPVPTPTTCPAVRSPAASCDVDGGRRAWNNGGQ
jgi:hypothetical protein